MDNDRGSADRVASSDRNTGAPSHGRQEADPTNGPSSLIFQALAFVTISVVIGREILYISVEVVLLAWAITRFKSYNDTLDRRATERQARVEDAWNRHMQLFSEIVDMVNRNRLPDASFRVNLGTRNGDARTVYRIAGERASGSEADSLSVQQTDGESEGDRNGEGEGEADEEGEETAVTSGESEWETEDNTSGSSDGEGSGDGETSADGEGGEESEVDEREDTDGENTDDENWEPEDHTDGTIDREAGRDNVSVSERDDIREVRQEVQMARPRPVGRPSGEGDRTRRLQQEDERQAPPQATTCLPFPLMLDDPCVTCIGKTQKGTRCGNSFISGLSRSQAMKRIEVMKSANPGNTFDWAPLKELADWMLCPRWHRDKIPQGRDIADRWYAELRPARETLTNRQVHWNRNSTPLPRTPNTAAFGFGSGSGFRFQSESPTSVSSSPDRGIFTPTRSPLPQQETPQSSAPASALRPDTNSRPLAGSHPAVNLRSKFAALAAEAR